MHKAQQIPHSLARGGYGVDLLVQERTVRGARALLVALLTDALAHYCQGRHTTTRSGQRLWREAQTWLWSDDATFLFSAAAICRELDLDLSYIRRQLLALPVLPARRPRFQVVRSQLQRVSDADERLAKSRAYSRRRRQRLSSSPASPVESRK